MDHVLLILFKSLSKDLIDRAHVTEEERRALRTQSRRDYVTACRRFQEEGSGFFTKTTPALVKHYMACLEAGSYVRYVGISHMNRSKLPCFMHGWLARIFDRGTGVVLDEVCTSALRALRQLSLFASKAKALPHDSLVHNAFKEFVEDEASIDQESLWSKSISTFGYTPECADQHFTVDRRFGTLGTIGRLFSLVGKQVGWELEGRYRDHNTASLRSGVENGLPHGILNPKHGPGSVAERLTDDTKWEHVAFTRNSRLDSMFDTYWYNYLNQGVAHAQTTGAALPQEQHPSRIIAVPKTALKPRLIAAEPVANMFWQQALKGFIESAFRDSWIYRSIKIDDQTVSQRRAQEGSTNLRLATIDLSKASDFVTLDHVGTLFHHDSQLLSHLLTARTEVAHVPNFGNIRIRKFASMGSAVCFPVESVVFLVAMIATILRQTNRAATSAAIKEVSQEVTVYGDDIILPTQYFVGALEDLRTLGFIPNPNKSFANSKFRESCGVEYYDGTDVKPVYVRKDFWLRDRLTDEDVMSLVDTSRQFFDIGLHRTAIMILEKCQRHLGCKLPYAVDNPGYLSHNIPWLLDDDGDVLYDEDHQLLKVRRYVPVGNSEKSLLDGYARLLRNLVRGTAHGEPDWNNLADHDWTKMATRGFKLKCRYI